MQGLHQPCILAFFVNFNIPFLSLFLTLIGGLQAFFTLVQVFLVFFQCLRVRAMEAFTLHFGQCPKEWQKGPPLGYVLPLEGPLPLVGHQAPSL